MVSVHERGLEINREAIYNQVDTVVPKWKNDEEHPNFPELQIPVWSANSIHYWIVQTPACSATFHPAGLNVQTMDLPHCVH